jgi:hypothetical protein
MILNDIKFTAYRKLLSTALLNAYLSELARKRIIKRALLKVSGRRYRLYRLAEQGSA